MNDLMKELAARKVEHRRQLAALPVGEKLRRLEEMVGATKGINATRLVRPVNPVRLRPKGEEVHQMEDVQDVLKRYRQTLRELAK